MPEQCPTCGKVLKNERGVTVHHGQEHPGEWENVFWYLVDEGSESECWEWTGTCDGNGCGSMRIGGGKKKAHRLAYTSENGEPEKCVFHRCGNRMCCNPEHLYEAESADGEA